MAKDTIYASDDLDDEPFRFNAAVARVFPDMLRRSIPGYAQSIEAIGSLAGRYIQPGTYAYDLGCSLGAASIAMRHGARTQDFRIVAIDNASAMVKRCKTIVAEDAKHLEDAASIEVVQGDIRYLTLSNASMVVLNYTLQFLPVDQRDDMIARIMTGMVDGGILLLSEKVVDPDPEMERLLVDLHHEHKRRNDYSSMEIAKKRAALENILIPETVADHRERLARAGFGHVAVWLRYFNFVSIIAIKQ